MKRSPLLAALLVATALLPAATLRAAGPDLVVDDVYEAKFWGQVGEISAYSIGTEVCNLGDQNADWQDDTNLHPVIAQNMFRLQDGRFEQLGMSWLKHGFFAVNGSACGACDPPGGGGTLLGVGCSDPYSSDLNGDQDGFAGVGGLGPRSEVNAADGVFEFPYGSQGQGGDAIYKRLQVRTAEIEPNANPGALYFLEGMYVTQDDAQSGNATNNASYRQVRVQSNLSLVFEAPTQAARAAIFAWQEQDPEVAIVHVDIPADGRMTLGSRVTDLGTGSWHYEYALYNMNSDRSGQRFELPIPEGVTVSNVGFHDVDYHSGEPFDGTDWPAQVPGAGGGVLSWATGEFAVDENANALRWGTLYNFWFDADAPPAAATAEIGLFKPGTPGVVTVATVAPAGAGGGIPCADVRNLQVRCVAQGPGSKLQLRVNLQDESHAGETVVVEVDGVPEVLTIVGRRAQLSVNGAAAGLHTLELVEPAGCLAPVEVTCP